MNSRSPSDRAPPGTWRLLAPASAGWVVAAAAIVLPGIAKWVAVCAGIVGVAASVALANARGRETGPVERQRGTARLALSCLVVPCAVLLVLGTRIDAGEHARAAPELSGAAAEHRSFTCEGRLAGYPEVRESPIGELRWVQADCDTTHGRVPVLLWLDDPPDTSWAPGLRVHATGVPKPLPASSNAGYGISVRAIDIAEPATLRERAGKTSAALRHRLQSQASTLPGAELVPGFAVGDTALIGAELERTMQISSLTHLVAVSGANCAIITSAVLAFAARLGAGRRLKTALAAAGLLGFTVVVGPDASVQRAAVMAAVVLVSNFGGKKAVALPALGTAMIVLLIADPWQALQPGFALSVAATAGILLLAPPIRRGLDRIPYLPQWIALPVAIALAAQLACGPLLLLLRPGIPAAGVLANVLAAPAAPIGTGLGLLAMLLLPLGSVGQVLGEALVWLASLAARWVAATAEVTGQLPFATLHWPGGWPGALLLAAVQGVAVFAWLLATGRISFFGLRRRTRALWGAPPAQSRGFMVAVSAMLAATVGVSIAVVAVTPIAERARTPKNWAFVACDVGQGDAILARDPAAPDAVMLIDTGDDPEKLRACLDLFGVSKIDLLVLTHDDRDHVGALGVIADRVRTAMIAPDTAEDAAGRPVRRELTAAGIPHTTAEAGQTGGSPGLRWRVLAPARGITPVSTNAASVVMHISAGELSLLALGDTGAEEHRGLLRGGADLTANIVKVAHHGSGDQDPALVAHVGAGFGLISSGADNAYGHPSPKALDALERAGTVALRTDQLGSIAVAVEDGVVRPWSERAPPRGVG